MADGGISGLQGGNATLLPTAPPPPKSNQSCAPVRAGGRGNGHFWLSADAAFPCLLEAR